MKHLISIIIGILIAWGYLAYTAPKEYAEIPYDPDTMTAGELIKELRKYDRNTPVYKVKDWTYTDYRGRMPAENLETVDVSEQHSDGCVIILL